MRFSSRLALSAFSLAALGAFASVPAAAQTLTFDDLTSEQGVTTDSIPFSNANSGSRLYDGVTFNPTATSDWEVIGNQYKSPYSTENFGLSHSGDYFLAGNAYLGTDNLGNSYTGLTISTTQILDSLYVGFDDNGNGNNDANKVTITAFGASGDLASVSSATLPPTEVFPDLNFLDTSAFAGLTGVTGYRFVTNSISLYAFEGQGYVIADDMKFSNPVPEASTTVSFALLLCLGLGGTVLAARKRCSI